MANELEGTELGFPSTSPVLGDLQGFCPLSCVSVSGFLVIAVVVVRTGCSPSCVSTSWKLPGVDSYVSSGLFYFRLGNTWSKIKAALSQAIACASNVLIGNVGIVNSISSLAAIIYLKSLIYKERAYPQRTIGSRKKQGLWSISPCPLKMASKDLAMR